MRAASLKQQVATAVRACEDKKAENIAILQMDKGAFTDFQVLSSGTNPRQVQAIADEVELKLKQSGIFPHSMEGYRQAEWILLDYVDFVVQVFVEGARKYYDLDRLWKSAQRLSLAELAGKSVPRKAVSSVGISQRKPARPTKKKISAVAAALRAGSSRKKAKVGKKSGKKSVKKKTARSGKKPGKKK